MNLDIMKCHICGTPTEIRDCKHYPFGAGLPPIVIYSGPWCPRCRAYVGTGAKRQESTAKLMTECRKITEGVRYDV